MRCYTSASRTETQTNSAFFFSNDTCSNLNHRINKSIDGQKSVLVCVSAPLDLRYMEKMIIVELVQFSPFDVVSLWTSVVLACGACTMAIEDTNRSIGTTRYCINLRHTPISYHLL